MARIRLVRRQGELEQVKYRKRDDGLYYYHDSEKPTDVVLGELDRRGRKQKVAVLLPREAGDGWERDGDTTWLSNPPARKRAMRKPPKGFRTWKAYMASIRPGAKKKRKANASRKRRASASRSTTHTRRATGGTMAKRKRKAARKATSRGRSIVVYANRPTKRRAHRRRHHRRNSPMSGIVGTVTETAVNGVIGGVTQVVGEATSRLVRSRIFGKPAGQISSGAIEAITAIVGGVAIQMIGKRSRMSELLANNFTSGGIGGVIRTTAKQFNVPIVAEALADDGPRIIRPGDRAYTLPAGGGRRRLASYPIASYPLSGMTSETDRELGLT